MKSGTRKSGSGRAVAAKTAPRRAPAPAAAKLKPGDTVWITKFALTEGIKALPVLQVLQGGKFVSCKGAWQAFRLDVEVSLTQSAAIARAKGMVEAQLVRTRRELARLEALNFDEVPS